MLNVYQGKILLYKKTRTFIFKSQTLASRVSVYFIRNKLTLRIPNVFYTAQIEHLKKGGLVI